MVGWRNGGPSALRWRRGAAPFGELGGLDLGLSSAAGQLLVLEPLRAGVASWGRRGNGAGGWDRGHDGANSRRLRPREF